MKKRSAILPSVHAAGKGIVIQITGDGESAKRALEMVQQELLRTEAASRRAKEEASGMSAVFTQARTALASIGVGFGVAAIIGGLRSVTENALQMGETILKASQRTGLAVDTLSTLHYAAAITGSDFDALVGGLSKMDKAIGEAADGNKKAAGFVRGLGLDATDLAGRVDGSEVAFHRFVQTLGATESPIRRNELAMGLLGKAGSQQIPMLIDIARHWDEFKQKAQEAGVQLTSQTAQQLADTNRRLKDMQQQIQGAELALTEGFVPSLGQMFTVMSGGKSQMTAMTELGNALGRTFAFVGEAIYTAASAFESLFSYAEGRSLTEVGRRDIEAAKELALKAQQMHDIAFGGPLAPKPPSPFLGGDAGGAGGGGGFGGNDSLGKPGKSDNPIAQAATALAQEQAKARADATRASDQAQLAELETQHKLLLSSDLEYYKAKFDIANQGFAAEQTSIDEQTKKLEELQKKQHGDKLLKRDANGNSAEELKTARELVQLKEKQDELDAKKMEAESRYTGEVGVMNNAAELTGLRAAASLERERNSGIAAQIALIQREHEIEAQKSTLAGGSDTDAQAIKDAGALAVQKLQLQQIEQNITRVEDDHRRAIEDTNDAVAKGDLSKRAAAQQTRTANAQELQDLRALVQQYDALAAAIGDPALIQKAKDLDEQLASLGRTDRRGTFGKEIQDGLQGITTSLIDSAARGKQSFADMAKSMLADLDKLALKMAEEKFILPLFEQAFGGGAGGKGGGPGAAGGAPTGNGGGFGAAFGLPSFTGFSDLVGGGPAPGAGGGGPSIYKPEHKQGGGFGAGLLNNVLGIAGKLATSAIKSKGDDGDDDDSDSTAPSSTVNIHNHGAQPIGGATSTTSWDSDLKQFIIDVVLQDKMEGGSLSQV